MLTHFAVNMIFHILLINLSPILADNELVQPLPLEVSHNLGTKLPQLPQMSVDADYADDLFSGSRPYNVYSNSLNSDKDIARYCPHKEIISKHLNRLCSQQQCDTKIKAMLKNYYSLLMNALNYRQELNTVNSNVNFNNLNDINTLAQKVLMNRNNNVKIKLSFEYELPPLQQNKCDQLCSALEKYANTVNNGLLNIDDNREAVKSYNVLYNYPTTLLTDNQSQRPVPLRITNYLPNSNSLSNPAYVKLSNLNSLQDLLPILPNSGGIINQNPLQNELPVLQEPIQQSPTIPSTNVLPVPSTENSKYDPLNNIIPALQSPDTFYPENPWDSIPSQPPQQYQPSPLQNPTNTKNNPQPLPINSKTTENSYPFSPKPKSYPDSYPETPSFYPLQNSPLTGTDPLEVSINNPLTNLQPFVRPEEPYPEELSPSPGFPSQNLLDADNTSPLQNIPLLQNPNNVNSYPSNSLSSPLNFDLLPNSALSPQNLLENANSNSPQYLPSLTSSPLRPIDYYSNQNILPVLQSSTEPSNYFQNILPSPFNPTEKLYSNQLKRLSLELNPLNIYNNPTNTPTIGYDKSYPDQNFVHQQQNVMQTQKLLQNISQSLQSFTGSKKYQEYVNALNRKYYDLQSYQNLKNNYNVNMDLTKSVDQEADYSTNNIKKAYSTFAFSKNNMILNKQLNELYNNRQQENVGILATENPILSYLAKLNGNLEHNVLSNLNQKQSTNIKMDSSSQTQQHSYNYYNRYSGLSNGLYPKAVQTHRNLLNQEIENLSKNSIPTTSLLNGGLNNALYNSHDKSTNQLQTNEYNSFLQAPNSYYNTNLNTENADEITEKYNVQLQHLHRLLAVSNLYKLNTTPNRNSFVELTYKLRHDRPTLDPYYYVKYRLPYEKFLSNVRNLLVKVPNLRNSPNHDILMGSYISEASNDLNNVNRNDLLNLVTSNGTLIKANLVETDNTNLDQNLKIVRRLNANIPLHSIFKTDGNSTKLSGQMMNPLTDYLKAQQKYLQHLQKSLARNEYKSDPYPAQAALSYHQNPKQPSYPSNKQLQQNAFDVSKYNSYFAPNTYHPSYNQV